MGCTMAAGLKSLTVLQSSALGAQLTQDESLLLKVYCGIREAKP